MMLKFSGTLANSQFSCLSAVPLSYTDFILKLPQPFPFSFLVRKQIPIAGAEDSTFPAASARTTHFSFFWRTDSFCWFNSRNSASSQSPSPIPNFGHLNIRYFFYFVIHKMTHKCITKNWVYSCHNSVHDYRIASIFKIPVPTDIVHHNEILRSLAARCAIGL